MGFFDLFTGGGGRSYNRRNGGMSAEYREALREIRKQKSKAYRIVRNSIAIAAALAGVLFALFFIVEYLRHAWLMKLIFIVFAVCVGGGMTLPWITQYASDKKKAEKGEEVAAWRKYVVYAYWGFIGVCTLLWIISVFLTGDAIQSILDKTDYDPQKLFLMLRVSIIVTIQAAIGTVVAISTMRYGKNYLGLRIVMYVAVAYLDFWVSWAVASVTIDGLTNQTVTPLFNTFLWVLAVLMAVGLGVAGGLFGRQARNKEIELYLKGDVTKLTEGEVDLVDAEVEPTVVSAPQSAGGGNVEQQLAKIKDLLDKGIITEEEYQAKRKDIIDKL